MRFWVLGVRFLGFWEVIQVRARLLLNTSQTLSCSEHYLSSQYLFQRLGKFQAWDMRNMISIPLELFVRS